jgi:apolipoprotein N-acyltransferase
LQLSKRAVAADPEVQVVVWPETMFPYPFWEISDDASPAPGETWTLEALRERGENFRELIAETARSVGKPMFLGIPSAEFGPGVVRGYNAVLHVDAQGRPQGQYAKQHRVMFGEYIPLANWFPWLYTVTPLTGGIEAGRRAESFTVDGFRLAPDVCYETALARVIRRQVVELRARGEEPDVLVNVTNDSWFRGSSELDQHLACDVFRAIEMRKPLVVAANTGFTAQIDAEGMIRQQGPRGGEAILTASAAKTEVVSFYSRHGDWLPWMCVAGATGLTVVGWYDRRKGRKSQTAGT